MSTPTSFIAVSDEDARKLMHDYQRNIWKLLDVSSQAIETLIEEEQFEISELFQWGASDEEKKLGGFKIPINEFLDIVSFIGMTKLMVSFGDDSSAPTGERPRFTLILQGYNDDGSIRSPYYKLILPIPMEEKKNVLSASRLNNPNHVPILLEEKWNKAWETVINNPTKITTSFCMVTTHVCVSRTKQVLNGYCFNHSDIIDTLYQIQGEFPGQSSPKIFKPENVNFYFVCHSYIDRREDYNMPKDIIGLMIGASAMDEEKTSGSEEFLLSSFYDFSAPCPPTCP